MLAGAALLGLSLKKAMAVSPGFRPDHVLTGECTVSWDLQRERVSIADRLLESIRQQPGITATGTITNIPLTGDSGKTAVTPRGYVPPAGQSVHGHYSYAVHGDYFSALGIDLREGRFLTSADSHSAERVCVVDEDLARRYWPNGGALGQRIALGDEKDDAQLFTVVGVVGAVKQAALTEAQGQGAVYLPYRYRDSYSIFIVTRTSQRPEAFAETLRKLVHAAHPLLAVDNIRSMDTRIADSLITRRSPALLAGIFAGVALLLAAIGTYGVLSYAVAQRTREIGIRMALGAQREQIGAQFLSLGLRLLVAGTLLGLFGALACRQSHANCFVRRAATSLGDPPRHCCDHERGITGCLSHPRASRDDGQSGGGTARRITSIFLGAALVTSLTQSKSSEAVNDAVNVEKFAAEWG
ncbi:MAG TPA: ABC transporter permease [Chthoniobacterales bacterium]|nr:ABC transporter permease [Chthoniobacterales bacterium]